MPRRSAADVSRTRAAAIDTAVRTASVEGLDGLPIGRLAEDMHMSKSGLFGLFGSKLELQIATLQAGIEQFLAEVWRPVQDVPAGALRLLALCDAWLDFHRREALPGGCFMTTAAVEWDARPGPVRDAVRKAIGLWLKTLAHEVQGAIDAGDLASATVPGDVAFQLNALASAASWNYRLTGEVSTLDMAQRCMRATLAPPASQRSPQPA